MTLTRAGEGPGRQVTKAPSGWRKRVSAAGRRLLRTPRRPMHVWALQAGSSNLGHSSECLACLACHLASLIRAPRPPQSSTTDNAPLRRCQAPLLYPGPQCGVRGLWADRPRPGPACAAHYHSGAGRRRRFRRQGERRARCKARGARPYHALAHASAAGFKAARAATGGRRCFDFDRPPYYAHRWWAAPDPPLPRRLPPPAARCHLPLRPQVLHGPALHHQQRRQQGCAAGAGRPCLCRPRVRVHRPGQPPPGGCCCTVFAAARCCQGLGRRLLLSPAAGFGCFAGWTAALAGCKWGSTWPRSLLPAPPSARTAACSEHLP